jgi:hypothetical protein
MTERARWTTADFDEMSWHDCRVYAFRLHEPGDFGAADVEFDIDFIVEWLCHSDRPWEFRVAPATLTFHDVFGLRVELDYAAPGAGMTPFSLAGVERQAAMDATTSWRMVVNWPSGLITFQSPGFTQVLRREPILTGSQRLGAGERDLPR